MGQEVAEIWIAQTDLQPGRLKSNRLPGAPADGQLAQAATCRTRGAPLRHPQAMPNGETHEPAARNPPPLQRRRGRVSRRAACAWRPWRAAQHAAARAL